MTFRCKLTSVALGAALAVVAFATFAPQPAAAQEDCRGYKEGSAARNACDARLSKWMIQQNKKIMKEGADGGCGDKCQSLIDQRNRGARGFSAVDADDEK